MKKITFTLLVVFHFCFAFGQGTIVGYSIEPTNPTDMDSITFYVNASFTSGGCELSSSGIGKNGNTIQANALHCLGMLAVICNEVDTFKIEPLPAGTYNFEMSLSSGAAPAPCTPGFAPDDFLSASFAVTSSTSVVQIEKEQNTRLHPNPAHDLVTLEMEVEIPAQISIYNVLGQLVFENNIHAKTYSVNTKEFAKGLYFYTVKTADYQNTHQLIVE